MIRKVPTSAKKLKAKKLDDTKVDEDQETDEDSEDSEDNSDEDIKPLTRAKGKEEPAGGKKIKKGMISINLWLILLSHLKIFITNIFNLFIFYVIWSFIFS